MGGHQSSSDREHPRGHGKASSGIRIHRRPTKSLCGSPPRQIHSAVDPVKWRAELERVGPRLARRDLEHLQGDWAGHLASIHKHLDRMVEAERAGEMLRALGSDAKRQAEELASREGRLLNTPHMKEVSLPYAELRQVGFTVGQGL
jgi:hypothetical protein